MKTKICRNHLSGLAAALSLLAGVTFTQPARAQETTWNNPTSGNWDLPANWNGGLPTGSSFAFIDNSGTATLPTGVTGTYGALGIGYGSGQSGALSITGGVLSGNGAYVGYNVGSNGSATVTSGTWTNSFSLYVAESGTGSLLVNGGLVSVNGGHSIAIGDASSSNGSVTVSSGTLSSDYRLTVGGNGEASLLVTGGLASSPRILIASGSGSAIATVSGGTLSGDILKVASIAGTGNLRIENGGFVSTGSSAVIGESSPSTGSVTVTGEGSTWVASGSLEVGGYQSSSNTLTIEDGALVKVGDASGETISFSTGGGTNNHLRLDGGYIALFGDQTAYVGSLITAGDIQLWDGSAWVAATAEDVQITYYANDASGEAAAQSATGYSGLGGYTIATAQAVPEPSTWALLALSLGTLFFTRRRRRHLPAKVAIWCEQAVR